MTPSFPDDLRITDTRAGRMLEQGDVRVTVAYVDGLTLRDVHITVRFKAFKDTRSEPNDKNWLRVPLSEATHVFIEVPNASGDFPDKVGTFYPRTGKFYADRNADPERVQAAVLAADWLNGDLTEEILEMRAISISEESYCGICGRTLTDPVSIGRGIGPECYGALTEAHHQTKKPPAPVTPPVISERSTARTVARTILATIASDCDDEAVDIIRKELDLWQSQKRQTLFDGR